VALGVEAWRLEIDLADLRPSGLVRWSYDPFRARHAVAAWLAHLALCATVPEGISRNTRWLSKDKVVDLSPVEEPRRHLLLLIELYRSGLQRPLHFFPKAAWETWKSGHEDRAAAGRAWRVTRSTQFAEFADPAYRLALRGEADPLDAEFFANARAFFAPMLAHATFESVV
ncbi:MAG: exodeoxyribonuclease V subunit gamma, partial [Pseudomonadota bacterium]|nr:exodeoxyribonuclease V subunit gamma [Pseudomonadota bacterium]